MISSHSSTCRYSLQDTHLPLRQRGHGGEALLHQWPYEYADLLTNGGVFHGMCPHVTGSIARYCSLRREPEGAG